MKKEEELRKDLWFFMLISIIVFTLDHFLTRVKEGCFLFVCIKKTINPGASFSLLSSFSWARILLIIVGILVLIICSYCYFKAEKKTVKVALALIFAGTLSNLLDRIFLGHVIDYFTISFLQWFPIFNLSDVSNTIGIFMLIIFLLKK